MTERRPQLRLQRRAVITFALLALLSSIGVAIIAYSRTRSVLVAQRETSAMRQAFLNARTVRAGLRTDRTNIVSALSSLATGKSSYPLIRSGSQWYAISVDIGARDIPADLARTTARGVASRQRIDANGKSFFVVGVPLPELKIVYFEAFPLAELQKTLSTLAAALATAATIAAAVAATTGIIAGRRLVRPLRELAVAADRIAHGDLAARLDGSGDRSLTPLVSSFNDMAATLQDRIDRDARFASNVSHEMRSPLTAIRASLGLVTSRLDSLPARAKSGVELLEGQVDRFERMVLDLLEISRLDATNVELNDERIDMMELVKALTTSMLGYVPLMTSDQSTAIVYSDKRFIERIVTNIIDNAQRHGGGLYAVSVSHCGSNVVTEFDDAGPGIDEADRARIFERFARGPSALHGTGSGLGLALVAEYALLLGGSVTAGSRPEGAGRPGEHRSEAAERSPNVTAGSRPERAGRPGGARFSVTLPIQRASQ